MQYANKLTFAAQQAAFIMVGVEVGYGYGFGSRCVFDAITKKIK
jgi:hypothetical protein